MPIGCINTPFRSIWSDPMKMSDLDGANAREVKPGEPMQHVTTTAVGNDKPLPPPAHNPRAPDPRRLLGVLTSAERKEYPVTTGFLDYFPDATAMVAHISYLGNQKHNPGQPLGWSRGKSADHPDCEARHLIERGARDSENVLHSAQRAWRAMADLQIELEAAYSLDPPRGAK